jgi:hypothetical protein
MNRSAKSLVKRLGPMNTGLEVSSFTQLVEEGIFMPSATGWKAVAF